MSNFYMIAFSSSFVCCIYHVWVLSLRSLFFSIEKQKRCGFPVERKWGGTGRSKGRVNSNQDVLQEKIIYF